jgi:cytochrome oxidase Cu insertion factor (SCO1/SenC/PrrC family)
LPLARLVKPPVRSRRKPRQPPRYPAIIRPKWPYVLLWLPVIGAAAVGAVVVRAASDGDDALRGSVPPGTNRLPAFTLREHTGRPFRSSELEGRVMIVTFLETKCKEACPIIARQIGNALRLLDPEQRRDVAAVAISTHPGDDTPGSVRQFLVKHRVLGQLHYLIGNERELRAVWRAFYVLSAFDSGDADTHSASVRVFDRDGVWISTLHSGVDLTAENLAHDAQVALR